MFVSFNIHLNKLICLMMAAQPQEDCRIVTVDKDGVLRILCITYTWHFKYT